MENNDYRVVSDPRELAWIEWRGVEYIFKAFLFLFVLGSYAALAVVIVSVMVSSSMFTGINYEEMHAAMISGGGVALAALSLVNTVLLYKGFKLLSVVDHHFSIGALGAVTKGFADTVIGAIMFLLGGEILAALRGGGFSSLFHYLLYGTRSLITVAIIASIIAHIAGYVAVLVSLLLLGSRYKNISGDIVSIGAVFWATSYLGLILNIPTSEILGPLALVIITYGLHKVSRALAGRGKGPPRRIGGG